jgi:hypothetical protein
MATVAEVLAAERLHQAAQARLAAAAAFIALAEWQSVSALSPQDTADSWLTNSILVIVAIRKLSRKLAVSHYQLIRALETGRTLGVPEGSSDEDVTLGELRSNFRNNAIDVASLPSPRTRSDDPDIRWFEEKLASVNPDLVPGTVRLEDAEVDPLIQELLDKEGSNDSVEIKVDKFDWPEDLTAEEVSDVYRDQLRKRIVTPLAGKARALRSSQELTPDQVIRQLEESFSTSGSTGSGTVESAGLDAGRAAVTTAIRSDRLVLAVARGTSSDPCAFCAMLASRGFVYKNNQTAGVGEEDVIKKYHVHCRCFPIYRWLKESELPELNAYFKKMWPIVTDGFFGVDALNAWRRWIYAKRKANPGAPHGTLSNTT